MKRKGPDIIIDAPDMACDNEFCINHMLNSPGGTEAWNKTQCTLYEVDPYEVGTHETGVRVDTCMARLRFHRMWVVEQRCIRKAVKDD